METRLYAINKPCSSAKTVSRMTLESYPHLKSISEQLHISGGTVDLLIGTDLADAFNDNGRYRREIRRTNCKEKLLRVVRHGNICFKAG